MPDSDLQRERYLASCARRFIDAEDELERFPARPAVRIRLRVTAKNREDVSVVALVPIAVYVRRIQIEVLRQLVVGIAVGKLPVLDLVDSRSSDLRASLFTEKCERAFHVLRIREHRDFDHAERA